MSCYAKIGNFGYNDSESTDPVRYCLAFGLDKNFGGSDAGKYGPASTPCQLYMAQKCSKNWDEACNSYYMENTLNHYAPTYHPNNALGINGGKTSLGDSLVLNSAAERYCEFPGCDRVGEQFDPLTANSPMIYKNVLKCGQKTCGMVCKAPANQDDNMLKMCLKSDKLGTNACKLVLNSMCKNSKDSIPADSELGKYCLKYNSTKVASSCKCNGFRPCS